MTAVISFFQRGNPVLVGDLLLSSHEPKKPTWLPTTGSVANVFPQDVSGFVPVGLVQKIVVISHRFAIAWSGSWLAARNVIADVQEASKFWSWAPDDVSSSIIDIIHKNEASELSLIWLLYDGKQVIQNGFNTIQHLGKEGYGRILSIGVPGALGDFDRLMDAFSFPDENNTSQYLALARSLATAAAFTLRELLDPDVLVVNWFGGGYEILILANNRFEKLDNFIIVMWDAEQDVKGFKITAPYYFQRHLYHGDILLIRAAKLESVENNKTKYSPRNFLVHPGSRWIDAHEEKTLPNVDFKASLFCNIVRLRTSDGKVKLIMRVSQWATHPPQMAVTEENGKIDVVFRSDYLANLLGY